MLPGLFGRDPWKNADITAFGYIVNIAQGRTLVARADRRRHPGRRRAAAVLDRRRLHEAVEPLARSGLRRARAVRAAARARARADLVRDLSPRPPEAAQPLPFAFGGEAAPVDYARAIADGALLALIASLAAAARPRDDAELPSSPTALPPAAVLDRRLFVKLSSPWLDPAFAARVPFALLLALALALTWYAAYHLARAESAQPLPFAFGGEAEPTDYARAIADGALLALIASLGLLQLGHETTPELVQLVALALLLYGLAASPLKPTQGGRRRRLALIALAASGAPTIAMLLAVVAALVTLRRSSRERWQELAWIGAGALLAAAAATALGAWANRLGALPHPAQLLGLARAIAWFAWPAWLLALWTLWQWRRRLSAQHVIVPLACAATLLGVWIAMAGSDRALMLALPALADPGGVRAADARAQRRGGDRLVLGLLLHHRGRCRLALLRRDADRHAGQAGRQRRPAVARLQP